MVVAFLHGVHTLLLLLFTIKTLVLPRGKDILMVQANDKKAENKTDLFPIPRSTEGDDSFFPNTKFNHVLSSVIILADTLLLPDLRGLQPLALFFSLNYTRK
jgi:hypothetical protein